MVSRWWHSDVAELYWLEATDRLDIGTDLRAPLTDASGRDNWRYTLFQEARIGDVVFHYDGGVANAIVGWSRVKGSPNVSTEIWAARGSYAVQRGAVPTEVPGYRVPLEGFTRLPFPLTLGELRAAQGVLSGILSALQAAQKGAIYFPFEVSERRPVRRLQGYAFKLPAAFVRGFPQLHGAWPIAGDMGELDEIAEAPEGRARTVTHLRRERSAAIVEAKKAQGWRDAGRLVCEACGLDYEERYGERGRGFIECHHTRPLSELNGGDVTRLEDLALVCASCHRMIHARRPWLTVEELRALLT